MSTTPETAIQTSLLVRRGRLVDGRTVDVTIAGDRITAVTTVGPATADGFGPAAPLPVTESGPEWALPDPARSTEPVPVVDATGCLVLPGLVDAHVHLDKALIGEPWQPHRRARDLAERIRLARDLQLHVVPTPLATRARRFAEQLLSYGTTAARSHVDVDPETGIASVMTILELKRELTGRLAVQTVAFPQDGIVRSTGTIELLEEALRLGVDLIGGLDPAGLDGDRDTHLDVVFGLAHRFDVDIDVHLHEPGEMGLASIGAICDRAEALGFQNRVAVSHAYCLAADEMLVGPVIERLARVGAQIITCATPGRSVPPVQTLRAGGVRVLAGSDNVRDGWSPFGNGDMLERAMLIAYNSGWRADDELELALRLATEEAATGLGLPDHGIEPGSRADLVIVPASCAAEA
ncbi:MAG: amidohydrolase family protein, partial [Chloroflexi bacterium]|nr:amidohydrolase family protein [Chloroflexota bacterium]